ncbi:MAG: hypothetical protein WC718_06760 [Phycisphaerales bacterium]|jgi:hypothetical protein
MTSPATKAAIGIALSLLGGGVILYGAGLAIVPLVGMYQGAVDHPLDQPDGAEQNVSRDMLHGVKIGAIGVVPMLAGSVLLKVAMYQKLRGKKK